MSLSVCLVTRNEEKNIERALRSVAGVADEMVVVETGSADRTAAVASGLGARVLPFAWQDDFSAARNFAVGAATGDWILFLNPDEELSADGRERLPACLAREDAVGFVVRVRDQLRADRPDYAAQTDQFRLFRRSAAVRYRGRLHPSPETPPEELARRQGKKIYAAEPRRGAARLPVGADPGQAALGGAASGVGTSRPAWSAPLPDRLRANSPDAERPAGPCRPCRGGGQGARRPERTGRADADRRLSLGIPARRIPRTIPKPTVARGGQGTGGSLVPAYAAGGLALAELHFREGNFAAAAPLLEELLRMGRTGEYDNAAGFQPDVMGAPALKNLGVCYTRLGELDKAQACFGQLLTHPDHQAWARQHYGMVEALRGRQGPPPRGEGSPRG